MRDLGGLVDAAFRRSLFYGVLGPPIGALCLIVFNVARSVVDGEAGSESPLAGALLATLFSYVVGGLPALVTGALSAGVRSQRRIVQVATSSVLGFATSLIFVGWLAEELVRDNLIVPLAGAAAGAGCATLLSLRAIGKKSPAPESGADRA